MSSAVRGSRAGLVLFLAALLVGSLATINGSVTGATFTPFVVVGIIAIVIGEQLPTVMVQRVVSPVTTATAVGMVLSRPGAMPDLATTLGIIWLSLLVGVLVARLRGRPVMESAMGARFLGIVVAAVLARGVGETTLVEWAFDVETRWAFAILAMFVVALAGSIVERILEGAVVWLREGQNLGYLARHEISSLSGITGVTATAGPLIAVAQPVLDWVSLPLFLLPVLLTQIAVQRAVAIRLALEESVGALSRLTEVAGYSREGHSRRVADLSVRIAREMGLEAEDVRYVERTAMLHDVGLIGLEEPIPDGATINASTQVQAQAAELGVRIVSSSPQLRPIAPALHEVRTPFRRVREFGEPIPVASRIVRVANAWDDITEGTRTERARQVALERLHLGLGYDYDPEVVVALERTLGQ